MEINLCGAFNIKKGENMEVKETKKKNFSWIKELIIILLGILIAMAYALRTDAASLENEILIRYEEVYANNSFENWNNTKKYIYSYSSPSEDSVNYFVVNGMDTNFYGVYIYSLEPIDIEVAITEVIEKNDGTIKEETEYEANYTDGKCYQKYTLSNGQDVYTYLITSYVTNSFDFVKYYQDIFCDVYIVSDINQVQKNLENILVNGQVPDIEYEIPTIENDMALVGFECNEYLEAFWTGISGLSGYSPGELVVEVKPSYVLLLDEGEELQPFEKPEPIIVPFENYSFSETYDYFFEGNPYKGRAILTLNFTPVFTPKQTNPVVYRGKSIKVTFDKNGGFDGYDIPVDGLVPGYSDVEFVLNNFNALSDKYQGAPIINCMWNGSSIDGLIDYVYSEIKVELYCFHEESGGWKWLEYPLDKIVSIKTNRLVLNLNDLAEYALSNNLIFKDVDKGSSMYKDSMIRITPFYKGYSDYVYGKSVVITTTYSGGIKMIQQSNGDGFVENPMYTELQKDYYDDHSIVGDYMDSVLDGFEESDINLDKVTLNFFTLLKGLFSAAGQFPSLFASVFSFLPDYFISMLVISFSLIIILRVIGR